MATISNSKLVIGETLPGSKVKVDVTCKLNFTAFELFTMAHGVKFRLECRLWGADGIFNSDDLLFSFPRKVYPDATPTAVENVTFTATIPSSTLNEDDSLFNRQDEVYAGLTLTNLETGVKATAKTNEIAHHF